MPYQPHFVKKNVIEFSNWHSEIKDSTFRPESGSLFYYRSSSKPLFLSFQRNDLHRSFQRALFSAIALRKKIDHDIPLPQDIPLNVNQELPHLADNVDNDSQLHQICIQWHIDCVVSSIDHQNGSIRIDSKNVYGPRRSLLRQSIEDDVLDLAALYDSVHLLVWSPLKNHSPESLQSGDHFYLDYLAETGISRQFNELQIPHCGYYSMHPNEETNVFLIQSHCCFWIRQSA